MKLILFMLCLNFAWANEISIQVDSVHRLIESRSKDNNEKFISENIEELHIGYTHAIEQDQFFSISSSFAQTDENEFKYGLSDKRAYQSRGFREPTLTYIINNTKDLKADYYKELFLKLTPSLFQKKSGGDKPNMAVGGHRLSIGGKISETRNKWDIQVDGLLNYFDTITDHIQKSDTEYKLEPFYTIYAGILVGYHFKPQWSLSFGNGMELVNDISINYDKDDNNSLIQQGTVSVKTLGLIYEKEQRFYSLKLIHQSSDFLIQNRETNFKGDFEMFRLSISMTQRI